MILEQENCIVNLENNKTINSNGIIFQEIAFSKKFNLRGDPNNREFLSSIGKTLNMVLPLDSNTYVSNKEYKIIWLGPNEWLIVEENNFLNDNLFTNLDKVVDDTNSSLTDISENKMVLRISGEKLNVLLSKFLILDLDNILKKEDSCAQTLFVKVPILILKINKLDEMPKVDIFVNRSQSNYVYNLLLDGTKNLVF